MRAILCGLLLAFFAASGCGPEAGPPVEAGSQDSTAGPDRSRTETDDLVEAMREVRIVKAVGNRIRGAFVDAETDLVLEAMAPDTSPPYLEEGSGEGYFIRGDKDESEAWDGTRTWRIALWVMPPDYAGELEETGSPQARTAPPLVLSAANGKVYASPGSTEPVIALLDVIAPLPGKVATPRNRLLAEIHRDIRRKLRSLAERHPQLTGADDWERVIDAPPRTGTVSVSLHQPPPRKSSRPSLGGPEEAFSLRIRVRPASLQPHQLQPSERFPVLRLVANTSARASDPALRADLESLCDQSLQPLRDLERKLRPAARSAEGELE